MSNEHLSERTDRIRQLNDQFRTLRADGSILFAGDLGSEDVERRLKVLEAVAKFQAFDEGNDGYGEHDYATFEFDGERFMFKIDYYDRTLENGSDDPADPAKTTRVMTIFYARDY